MISLEQLEEMFQIAEQFKIESYDGMDVGPVNK